MAKGKSPGNPRGERHQTGLAAAVQARFQQALAFQQRGQLREAAALYREVLAHAASHVDALHMLGIVEAQSGNLSAAVELIGRAIGIRPDNVQAHFNLGLALQGLRQPGNALACYDRAVALNPRYADAHNNRGTALEALGRPEEALSSYERALRLNPVYVDALINRGNVLIALNRPDESLASYDRALAEDRRRVEAHCGRGNALLRLKRNAEAVASYDRALALRHDPVEALNGRGAALAELRRSAEALSSFDQVLALRPGHEKALTNRGMALLGLKRHQEAAESFARLLEVAPGTSYAKGHLHLAKAACCDWTGIEALAASIETGVRAGARVAEPFGYQAIAGSEADLKKCAEIYAADRFPARQGPPLSGASHDSARIRVGYLSGEFRSQATSILITELFELHDRSRVELFAFDNGWDDGSNLRRRINRAFNEVVDISGMPDSRAAELIHQRKIDLLVNLNGYFGESRTGVFACRPCPVQINYLGFPGTMGAAYIDYIVADRHVIPPGHDALYTEKVVRLPDSYQVNDSKRPIAERTPGRDELQLPAEGFVFCCFNNSHKIAPAIFDVWMRLLDRVAGSVLWLLEDNAAASRNLRREAERRGVAPERLVFAPRIDPDLHLARHQAADLFLDTLPYNAHTTASDALWAGLPLLTCCGSTFPGRVASSLLSAIGLPELITRSLQDYEALALELAADAQRLAALRARLVHNRLTHPLFDTDRFRRHLESAYVTMWERSRKGEPPVSFTVEPGGTVPS